MRCTRSVPYYGKDHPERKCSGCGHSKNLMFDCGQCLETYCYACSETVPGFWCSQECRDAGDVVEALGHGVCVQCRREISATRQRMARGMTDYCSAECGQLGELR